MTSTGPAGARLRTFKHLVTAVLIVPLILLSVASGVALSGCRPRTSGDPARADNGKPAGGGGGASDPSRAGAIDDSVLWVWPPLPDSDTQTLTVLTVFFRFKDAPRAGTLRATVTPHTGHHLHYTGDIVTVNLERLQPGQVHEVALTDASSGAALARTRVAAHRGGSDYDAPYLTVGVGRKRTYPGGGYEGLAGPYTGRLSDGATVYAAFDDVVINIFLPGSVSEAALKAAVAVEPAEATYRYTANWYAGSILQVRWPGVPVEAGQPFPDPAEAIRSGQAPTGFALEMKLTLDSAKLPGFADKAGADGLLRVSVVRRAAPSFRAGTDDDLTGAGVRPSFTLLPYLGYRDIYTVTPEAHRFRLDFSKPMDRASVERSLVQSSQAWQAVWSFDWRSDRHLDLSLAPAPGTTFPADVLIYPEGALDQEGLPLWFTEPLVVRWARPATVVRAVAKDLVQEQAVLFTSSLPPGLIPAGWRPAGGPGGGAVLFLEPARNHEDGPVLYHLWLYRPDLASAWEDLGAETAPCLRARWLDAERVFIDRGARWEVFRPYARSGEERSLKVDLDRSEYRWLGVYPSPAGDLVAAFRAPWSGSGDSGPVDLVVFDPAGRQLRIIPAVTRLTDDDFYLECIAAAWLPGGDGLVFVDRREDGGTQLARVGTDGASSTPIPLPDTTGAVRWQGEALAVFRGPGGGVCVAARFNQPRAYGGPGGMRLVELDTGANVRLELPEGTDLPHIDASLASPDGRQLALTGGGRTFVISLGVVAGPGPGPTGPRTGVTGGETLDGTAVEWSPGGDYLYLYRPGE